MSIIRWIMIFLIVTILAALDAKAEKILCIGDSVTADPNSYCKAIGGINKGVGGDTSWQLQERWDKDVVALHPTKIILMAGLNDPSNGLSVAQFRSHMLSMINRKPKRAKLILMTSNIRPVDYLGETKEQLNAKLYPFIVETRRLARVKKLKLVDVYQIYSELSLRANILDYFHDIIHPNALGQQVITEALKQKL
jgi:acyl-CoA thioesterase I